jgi:hypothetical protein
MMVTAFQMTTSHSTRVVMMMPLTENNSQAICKKPVGYDFRPAFMLFDDMKFLSLYDLTGQP